MTERNGPSRPPESAESEKRDLKPADAIGEGGGCREAEATLPPLSGHEIAAKRHPESPIEPNRASNGLFAGPGAKIPLEEARRYATGLRWRYFQGKADLAVLALDDEVERQRVEAECDSARLAPILVTIGYYEDEIRRLRAISYAAEETYRYLALSGQWGAPEVKRLGEALGVIPKSSKS